MENITQDYFIVNKETGKLELHFDKSTYQALDDDAKAEIKSNFLWGRRSGCWISRCKEPNLYSARRVAQKYGLTDAGKTGERLSFAEQMERKAERAERRAERYDARSEAAEKRGEALQKPINDMHGDIAFFTQPNINTSAGRAFTRRREKMFAAFDRGFEEFRKSAYWQGRAETARATASQKELQNRGFVQRRIAERESSIRKVKKGIEEYEGFLDALDRGETPRDHHGWEVKLTPEQVQEQIEAWLDRLEALLDELGFYQGCMDSLGGVKFNSDNIKVGYHVRYRGKHIGEVISRGPKNCTLRDIDSRFNYTPVVSYAEIDEIVRIGEAVEDAHPFRVGEEFTCSRWIPAQGRSVDCVYRIVKVTDKTVTLQTGDEKPFIRKPTKAPRDGGWEWWMRINDGYRGTITRKVGCNTK